MTDEQLRRADEQAQGNESTTEPVLSPEEMRRALHELHVHQIELEMQNEELRRAQTELEALRARYFDLYDLAPVGYVTLGEQEVILEANATIATLLGVPRDALVNQPITRFVFKDDQDLYYRHRNQFKEFLEPNACGPRACELRMVKQDGSPFWVQLEDASAHEADGLVVHLVVISDITMRKHAESELNKTQGYLANILDSMPSVLVGVDPQGLVTHWNNAAADAAGVSAGQARGRPLEAVFPRLISQMENVRAALRDHKPQSTKREMFKADNEQCYQDVMIYPLAGNGVEGAVIRVDDVTQRVQIEELMVQSEKMMSVGGLAAGMAHEINNPLSGILQSAQVVISHLQPDLAANRAAAQESGCSMENIQIYATKRKILYFLESIRESGTRAARIVSNMLDFCRESHSRHNPEDINALLDKTVELAYSDYDLKKKYDFRQVHIVREYDKNLPAVFCSRTEIEQVILNLLKNAVQAMTPQEARSDPPTIVLRTARDGDCLRFEVEDNGPGMTEAVRKRIFEPFFTTKPVGEGSGLGLAVSYFIIATNHNGRFDVQSQPGKGARFTIHIPLSEEHAGAQPGATGNTDC